MTLMLSSAAGPTQNLHSDLHCCTTENREDPLASLSPPPFTPPSCRGQGGPPPGRGGPRPGPPGGGDAAGLPAQRPAAALLRPGGRRRPAHGVPADLAGSQALGVACGAPVSCGGQALTVNWLTPFFSVRTLFSAEWGPL